ncbi:glycosyltransferase family 4 protein [Rubellimicrobium roseum]|uniref:Glycosyltransferase family 4 protein n=1 Tax=Rubellimicrobium roseum TaxID=687525 RepID=A0A5C4NDF0_9RHOB|nr:glycosyltransferase family 4 protein [Rubellimicrobium roseum]TNC70847.1 glycosyltransferase family 4 protein [Rubellimicrobium roseum]
MDGTSSAESMRLESLLTLPFTGRGVSYSCDRVVSAMRAPGVSPHVTLPYVMDGEPSVPFHAILPRQIGRPGRRISPGLVLGLTENAFLRRLPRGDSDTVAYIWSDTSPGFARSLRERGTVVVREKVNCSKALARRVLDDAYRRIGHAPQHGISDEALAEENERLALADAIFCPSECVAQSLVELGVPEEKLLRTSYGFDPDRFASDARLLPATDGVTFVFVGTICVRKGAHLILKAWARSGIKGRLVLAGPLEPAVETVAAQELARPDVLRLPFVNDVAALYKSADVFVLPSLEEGDPLVTREAAFCGLPSLVSPMGAGQVVQDGQQGYILDPYAEDDWVEALRSMAAQPGLRQRMGAAAHERSLDFTWSKVGVGRRRTLTNFLSGRSSPEPRNTRPWITSMAAVGA